MSINMRHGVKHLYIDTGSWLAENLQAFKGTVCDRMEDNWGTDWRNNPDAITDFEQDFGFSPNQLAKVIHLFERFMDTEDVDPRFGTKDEEL